MSEFETYLDEKAFSCEEDSDESQHNERECIECGEMGYPIDKDLSKPFMCSNCKRLWS